MFIWFYLFTIIIQTYRLYGIL